MAETTRRPEELLAHGAFVRRIARGLVNDPERAEDLAQSALAAGLERGPDEPGAWRAWLASTVRRIAAKERRGAGRRDERERGVARAEASASVAELVEREALRRRVVEALLALDEPYRSTLVLRFYDGLPPRRIARGAGVPVETVRTRTKRGLAMLRARLDRELDGGRAAWCALLAPLAREPIPFTEAAREGALEVLAMSTQAKLVVAGAALAGLALFLSRAALEREEPLARAAPAGLVAVGPRAVEGPASEPHGALAHGADEDARGALVAPATAEAGGADAAPDPFGAIELRLVRERDGEPLAAAWVRVVPLAAPDGPFRAFDARTDASGAALLERVPAGRVRLSPLAGAHEELELAPGQRVRRTLRVPSGYDVQGEVVDASGRPVGGAELWVSDVGNIDHGLVVGTSEDDGGFHLTAIGGSRFLAARSARHAPSDATTIFGPDGVELRKRLVLGGPAGRVEGRVRGADGTPLEGALVRVGMSDADATMDLEHRVPPFDAATDADGRFALEGVAVGTHPIAARAHGHAPWQGEVELFEGRTARVEIELGKGASLAGVVRDAEGAPAAGAWVTVGSWGKLGHRAKCGHDGSFLLEHLESGEIHVRADGGARGRAEAVLHVLEGARAGWEPLLSTGLALSGRVVGEDGAPCAGWTVRIQSLEAAADAAPQEPHFDWATTDAEGGFRFVNLVDRDHELAVDAPRSTQPSLERSGVRPGDGELVLRVRDADVPSVFLSGRVVGLDGEPPGDAKLVASRRHGACPIEFADARTGEFELGPYPSGEWTLGVRVGEGLLQHFGPRALRPGERWELGTIEVGGTGSLLVRLRRAPDAPADAPRLALEYAGHSCVGDPECEDELARAAELAPGPYVLKVGGFDGFAAALQAFDVRAGEETLLDVELEPGLPRVLRVAPGRDMAGERFVELEVARASGEPVLRATLAREGEPDWRRVLSFAPGSYRAEARTNAGARAFASFAVASDEADPPPVELRLE